MKRLLIIVTLAFFPVCVAADGGVDDAKSPSNVGGMRGDQQAEAVIRELYAQFETEWNRHDGEAMAAMWTIDGDHIEPDGTVAKGRHEVGALLVKMHATVFKESKLALEITDVWFLTQDVALIDGDYTASGLKFPDGTPIETREGHVTAVLMKERGKWWIAASRLSIPIKLPYKGNEG